MTQSIARILTAVLMCAAPAAAQGTADLSAAMANLKGKAAAFGKAAAERRAALKASSEEEEEFVALRQAAGINETASNRTYSEYDLRGEDKFLISNLNFSTREEAARFCTGFQGYRLGNATLAMYLAMAGLPFKNLRDHNQVKEPVLGSRSGLMFWVQGDRMLPESQLSRERDTVWVLLDGCGPNCQFVATLRRINEELVRAGQQARRLPAICAETKSRDF